MSRADRGDAGRHVQIESTRAERRFGRLIGWWELAVDQLADEEDAIARRRVEARQGYDDFLAESAAHLRPA